MILLLGGTSETSSIATRLAEAGLSVLVSTATDEALEVGRHPRIERRSGRLDAAAMAALARERSVRVLVDATHPYAAEVRATAARVAADLGLEYFTFVRPGFDPAAPGLRRGKPGSGDDISNNVHCAATHAEAASVAFSFGRPVLLTTGSTHLGPYAEASRRTGVPLVARVLPREESVEACRAAGIPADRIIAARGPFSISDNVEHIRRHAIGVLVTKDSGAAGGVPAKLDAASAEGCAVVLIERPASPRRNAYADIDALVAAVVAAGR